VALVESRDSLPEISVIVPVRDRPAELAELVAALERQTLRRESFEVVIADDGSVDASIAWFETPDGRVRILRGAALGAPAARNRAARAARAPLLATTDSDCLPEPGWLEAGLAVLEEAELAAGPVRSLVPERPSVWALLYMERLDQEGAVRSGQAMTANLFVRRELFEGVGGFDESLLSGPDYDFVERCLAAGAKLTFTPAAVVRHASRDTGREYLGKAWTYYRWHATRRGRSGRPPTFDELLAALPLAGVYWARRRLGMPLRLDRRRLGAYGVEPRLIDDLLGLAIIYLLLPGMKSAAGVYGWLAGRRSR
jgi:GT2 family glycosyltransferase